MPARTSPPPSRRLARLITRAMIYLVMLAVPVVLALATIGSTPALLAKVPAEYRGTVQAIGDGAARLSGAEGGIFGFDDDAAVTSTTYTAAQAVPRPVPDEWEPRRQSDFVPPDGLIPGVDYAVETTDEGVITHWPCTREIPVHTYAAPPGSEDDLIWAVDTLSVASGLPLRYAGPGTEDTRDADGMISVYYDDQHEMFADPEVAGVGGVAAYPDGLVLRGSVTLKPDQITTFPGDPWSRSLTLHELMHAVGVGHAAVHRDEIMTSRRLREFRTELGTGDQFAVHMVGCR